MCLHICTGVCLVEAFLQQQIHLGQVRGGLLLEHLNDRNAIPLTWYKVSSLTFARLHKLIVGFSKKQQKDVI